MRPRTKSITSGSEYFGQPRRRSSAFVDEEEDDWMAIALGGSVNMSDNRMSAARRLRAAYRSDSSDSVDSIDSNCSWWTDEDEEEDGEGSCGFERARTCSHDRRISFHDEVDVVTIPSRDSLDEEDKRRMWYSHEEFRAMRHTSLVH